MEPQDTNSETLFDVAIIGGGPVGQYAAYYAGLRQMRTIVIDSLPELGGQLTALYPEKFIFDVAGFPKVYAKDLVNGLTEQMMQYNPTVLLEEKVVNLESAELVHLTLESGKVIETRSAIITGGVGAFAPRKPAVEGLERYEGKGLQYAIRSKASMANKRLMIAGAGDSAFDWAFNLSGVASAITMIHRSDKFRAHEDTVLKVLEGGEVNLLTFHEVRSLHGDDRLEGVTIFDNRTKEEFYHEVDELLLTLGFLSSLGPIKQWGLEITGNSIEVNSKMETNIPRVYAAGDIVTYVGKLKLIATGFGEAAIAVNHAKAFIDPGSKAFPGHSSDSVPDKH